MAKKKKKDQSISDNVAVAEANATPEQATLDEAETTAEIQPDPEEKVAEEPQTQEESAESTAPDDADDQAPVADGTEEDGAETEEISSLKEQLEQAQQEAATNLENWQRTAAEMANFKRRKEEQLKLQRDRIKSDVLEGVISALDDMDLAFQNVPNDIDGQLVGWVEGFRLVQRKLDKVLDDQQVTLIKTDGDFDPNYHEAVSYEESEEHQEGQIIGELRKGYRIGNRVLRPALVRVAK